MSSPILPRVTDGAVLPPSYPHDPETNTPEEAHLDSVSTADKDPLVQMALRFGILDTGLRGVPVGTLSTSQVSSSSGVSYRGIPMSELADRSVESVMSLILDRPEGTSLSNELKARSEVPSAVIQQIRSLPANVKPMARLSMAITLLGELESTGEVLEDQLRLLAKLPALCAEVINAYKQQETRQVDSDKLTWSDGFVQRLATKQDRAELLSEALKLFIVLHMDHGGGNLSAFTGKVVASGLSTQYEAISASITALGTPRHGRANQDSLEFLKRMHTKLGSNPSQQELKSYITRMLDAKQAVPGFGHRVLRVEDPRATKLYAFAKAHFADQPLVTLALNLRETLPALLKELKPSISNPNPNVDAISGAILHAAGMDEPKVFPVIFALARAIGITQQITEERAKRVPIMRPKYLGAQ